MDLAWITRSSVLSAIREIDQHGVPKRRQSVRFDLLVNGKRYPPKYVIALSHRYAKGRELDPQEHSGGDQSNSLLTKLGFQIVGKG